MHKPIPLRPHRLALRQHDAATVFNVEYRLEPTQTGTRFTQVSEFAWKRLPGYFTGRSDWLYAGRYEGSFGP
jgi:hypothetical protein